MISFRSPALHFFSDSARSFFSGSRTPLLILLHLAFHFPPLIPSRLPLPSTAVEQDSYFSLGEGVTFCGFLSIPRNKWRLCKEQSVCRAKSKAVPGFSSTRQLAMLLAWSIFLFLSSELDERVRV